MSGLTHSEMIAALEEILAVQEDPEGYYTAVEWGEMMSVSKAAVSKRLNMAKKLGRLEVARVKREALDGRDLWIPGYRISPV